MIHRQTPFSFLAVLGLSLAMSTSGATAQGINIEKKKSQLHEFSGIKLRGKAKSDFKEFKRKGEFYGAFYVNPAEKISGSFANASSPEVADDYARGACAAKSRNPFGCVLYARILPKKYDPSATGITLSRQGNKDFREYQRVQDPERYGAFAQSDNGASGFSWAEHSRDMAEREALRRCEKAARKLLRKTPDSMKPTVSDADKMACKIVHRSG